jgi:hypothetical protein
VDQRTLRERFDKDPAGVFLKFLRDADGPVTATKVKNTLIEAGLPKPLVDKQWEAAQRNVIKYDPHVVRATSMSYRWSEKPVDPDEALDRVLDLLKTTSQSKLKLRDALADVIRAGLKAAGEPADQDNEVAFRAAQDRQLQINGVRAIAELAGEIEFVAYNSGDPDVIVERVQTAVQRHSLEQIGHPGEAARFDLSLHEAIGEPPHAGSPVTIVRPGYSWRAEQGAVLQRAQVAVD